MLMATPCLHPKTPGEEESRLRTNYKNKRPAVLLECLSPTDKRLTYVN